MTGTATSHDAYRAADEPFADSERAPSDPRPPRRLRRRGDLTLETADRPLPAIALPQSAWNRPLAETNAPLRTGIEILCLKL